MSIIAATVSSSGRISVGPKQTPMLDTVIRFFWLYSDTLYRQQATQSYHVYGCYMSQTYYIFRKITSFIMTVASQFNRFFKRDNICICITIVILHNNNNTHLSALCPGLPGWASTKKVLDLRLDLLEQQTVSGSSISCKCKSICKSAPHPRQITMPAPHHSIFYRPDVFSAAQPTASKHWRRLQLYCNA